MTWSNPDASANAPCTMTTVGFAPLGFAAAAEAPAGFVWACASVGARTPAADVSAAEARTVRRRIAGWSLLAMRVLSEYGRRCTRGSSEASPTRRAGSRRRSESWSRSEWRCRERTPDRWSGLRQSVGWWACKTERCCRRGAACAAHRSPDRLRRAAVASYAREPGVDQVG